MLIDSHCHLPHRNYEMSLDKIISEAKDFGVDKFINIGTSISENKKVIDISAKYPQIFCSIGVYPHENQGFSVSDLKTSLQGNLKLSKKIVAIGECGIDVSNFDKARNIDNQKELFEMQLILAKESRIPIIVHNRKGDDYVLELLNKHITSELRGVIHCFDSNWDFAKKILDLGLYISFTNLISYPRKDDLLDVVKKIPDNRFLVETDAPYLPPQSLRGKINYPKYVKIVAEKVAQVKQKTFEEVSQLSYNNTCSLFKI